MYGCLPLHGHIPTTHGAQFVWSCLYICESRSASAAAAVAVAASGSKISFKRVSRLFSNGQQRMGSDRIASRDHQLSPSPFRNL